MSASRLSGFGSAHVSPGVKTGQMQGVGTSLRHTMSAVLDTSLQVKASQGGSTAYLPSGAASAAAYVASNAASNAAAAQQAIYDGDQPSADLSNQTGNEQVKGMTSPTSRALQAPGK